MLKFRGWGACALALMSVPALAGEEVLYEPVPDWVAPKHIDLAGRSTNTPIVLIDQQSRIADGQLWAYTDTALALDSPEALTQLGTLTAGWMPDKGDLRIHRVELLRGGETIDLLAGGARFEVLRREQQLESRMINGALTATMPLVGARIGDVARLTYSITVRDQAMGQNVQIDSTLLAKPIPLRDGQVSIAWPAELAVSRKAVGGAAVGEPERQGDLLVWRVPLPIAEQRPTPTDAPMRYRLSPALQVSTYSDWQHVSRAMAPHYRSDGTITPGGALAGEVARIAAQSSDPLTRTALALQLVQDQVSYLLNGLEGGNYLPQSPEDTWTKRFGDCKAKSLMLMAILRDLGVEADVVMANTTFGDALPQLVPMPGNFDHMIVRAQIEGADYWLDGTTTGTRLDTIDEVPRFHYILPLSEDGSDLVQLAERPQSTPDQFVRLKLDQSAGIRVPALFEITVEQRGAMGGRWRSVAEQGNAELLKDAVYAAVSPLIGPAQMTDHAIAYDIADGKAVISAKGLMTSPWKGERARFRATVPAQAARDVGFDADRARAAWRDIPLRLNGPLYFASEIEMILPDEGKGFTMDGVASANETIGGVELASKGQLAGGRFTLSQTMRSMRSELPATDIPGARRDLARYHSALPVLESGKDFRWTWDYQGRERRRLSAIEVAYDKLVADADEDDNSALTNRAGFRRGIFDFAGAKSDLDAAIAIEESRELFAARGVVRRNLGDLAGALEDFIHAEELQPDGSTYDTRIEILALLDRADEGLALSEEFRGLAGDRLVEDMIAATALGWAGQAEEGLEMLEVQRATRPADGNLLNAICWHMATFALMTDERMQTCEAAVERSEFAAATLDSRAFANLRLGRLDAARADLDAALLAEPGLAPSMLLRGAVRLKQGDKMGQEDIDLALTISPALASIYRAWGLEF